ncbi:PSMD8 isoform 4 [Pan troglodytes]|uniref:Proteasome 26S subunit, non-ATPase 8 n=5 Tax=Homininae TaxID=207598 RepID=K7ENY6_HUMAN|nr:proteasome 26S subunit, non-ATPase 8 [Homo sapiens]KAI4042441.1 proteasome 26S subunit, non-ATPase 8 [Homo sapiens]PNI94847.1 PSMD8 isoform 4 [Pan troglodytes]
MAAAAVNGAAGFSSSGPAATSGAVLQAATGMYEQLKGEWNRKSPNLSKCGEELGRLKLVLLELNFLPTTGTKLTKQQLILARECHWGEIGLGAVAPAHQGGSSHLGSLWEAEVGGSPEVRSSRPAWSTW